MSFWEQFIVSAAVAILRQIVRDPKRYAGIKHLVDELRRDVDAADDALNTPTIAGN